ncbi:MAG: nicotinamide mononucleotide transporter [Clostridia bacterium]|nr:nicotinamide mononucleotide transporter [Clostridia bacterium]
MYITSAFFQELFMKIKKMLNYFSLTEKLLWSFSVLAIIVSFLLFDKENYLTLIASIIGVTSLIFCAKGNPFGQILMVIFAIIYSVISYSFQYFGEMVTYLGMTLPMAIFSLIVWLKNPFKENHSEVSVNRITLRETIFMMILTSFVTFVFYYILDYFNTTNLIPSTISVATSFFAAYLTFRRNPYFALAYTTNDIVLIVLWVLASLKEVSYISVVICFVVFLINDLYGFISWIKMQKRQEKALKNLLEY